MDLIGSGGCAFFCIKKKTTPTTGEREGLGVWWEVRMWGKNISPTRWGLWIFRIMDENMGGRYGEKPALGKGKENQGGWLLVK